MRDILRGHLRATSRSIRWRRRGAAAAAVARAVLPARRASAEGGEGFAVLLDGKPVRTPARRCWPRRRARSREAIAAEWEAQREVDRSGAHAADAARQHDHRRGGRRRRGRSRPRSRNISAPISCSIAPTSPEGLVARQARHWDPVLAWARDALGARFVLAQGVIYRRAAGGRRSPPRRAAIPARSVAARRGQRRHHADRLGAARARARRTARLTVDAGLDGGACRRGLEHGVLGPRRAGAASAARSALPKCRRRRRCSPRGR